MKESGWRKFSVKNTHARWESMPSSTSFLYDKALLVDAYLVDTYERKEKKMVSYVLGTR